MQWGWGGWRCPLVCELLLHRQPAQHPRCHWLRPESGLSLSRKDSVSGESGAWICWTLCPGRKETRQVGQEGAGAGWASLSVPPGSLLCPPICQPTPLPASRGTHHLVGARGQESVRFHGPGHYHGLGWDGGTAEQGTRTRDAAWGRGGPLPSTVKPRFLPQTGKEQHPERERQHSVCVCGGVGGICLACS